MHHTKGFSSLTAWNFGHNVQGGVARQPTADLAIGIPFKSVNGLSGAGAVVDLYGSVADSTAGLPGGLAGGFGPTVEPSDDGPIPVSRGRAGRLERLGSLT